MDLSRLQSLAEPFGWKIEPVNTGYRCDWVDGDGWFSTLTPIRARLEAEYRKLAEQAQSSFDVFAKLNNFSSLSGSIFAAHFTRIADELSVVEEPTIPTMLERLHEARRRTDRPVAKAIETILDALIDLYERKEK